MSLKHFHVVFIVLAVLCSLGFAAWVFLVADSRIDSGLRVAAVASGFVGILLAAYGVWFVAKKSKGIIV